MLCFRLFFPDVIYTAYSLHPFLQVMFFIHGGGYIIGDAQPYLPTDLVADYDVIVVTSHYRLGLLGFLGTGDDFAPGNNALRDLQLGLKWVKDNIRAFGGDPDDVTIFGQSAGSGLVNFLSLSPQSKGLFSKAIMQSGTAVNPVSILTKARAVSNMFGLAVRVGCLPWYNGSLPGFTRGIQQSVVQCLRNKPVDEFATSWPSFEGVDPFDLLSMAFVSPFVDGDVVPDFPQDLLQDADYLRNNGVLDRKYMVGINSMEGKLYYTGTPDYNSMDNFTSLVYYSAKSFFGPSTNTEMLDVIKFQYGYPLDQDGRPPLQGMLDMYTDTNYLVPTVQLLTYLTQASPTTDTFMYLFDYSAQVRGPNNTLYRTDGANHGLELAYLFDESNISSIFAAGKHLDMDTDEARAVGQIFKGMWTDFAKSGNPTSAAPSSGQYPVWPRFDLRDQQFMRLSDKPVVEERIYPKRVSLWLDFLPTLVTNSTTSLPKMSGIIIPG